MKNKQIMRAAVLTYANEVAKNFAQINAALKSVNEFKTYGNLLENASDAEVFKEILGLDKLFGKKKPQTILANDEQAVVKVLKDKIASGIKQLPALSKMSIQDPINLGVALDKMVDVVKDVKDASDVFERLVDQADPQAREELEAEVPEIMKAKMGLFGMVAFKLTELRKEAQAALQKLVSIVPSGQLSHALKLAQGGYTPSLPLKSVQSQIAGLADMGSPGGSMIGGVHEHRDEDDFTPGASAYGHSGDWNDYFSNDRESGLEGEIENIISKAEEGVKLTPEEAALLRKQLRGY